MRAVIDTNVLLSALLWRGPPHALLEQVRNGTVTLLSSPALLAELAEVIARTKFNVILALCIVRSKSAKGKRSTPNA